MSKKWKMVLMFASWIFWQVLVHLIAMSSVLRGTWPPFQNLCFACGGAVVALFALVLVQNARYDHEREEPEEPTLRYYRTGDTVSPVPMRNCVEIPVQRDTRAGEPVYREAKP